MTTPGSLPSSHPGNRPQRGNPQEVIDLTREEITFTNLFAELRTHIRNSPEHSHYPLISILAYLIYQGKHPMKTSKMLGSVSEGAVDEECMAEAK